MEQPELYEKVATAVANAEAERDTCQLRYDELIADLDKTLRSRPVPKGEKPPTEGSIKQELTALPKVKRAAADLLLAKREAKLSRALEKAFEQRADMLKKLVDLHLRSTYGYALEAGVGQSRTAYVEQQAERNRAARRR